MNFNYTKSKAIAVPIVATVSVGHAIAYFLAIFGIGATAVATYENKDKLEIWGQERYTQFIDYSKTLGLEYDKVNNWFQSACNGVLDKSDIVWSKFKSWVSTIHLTNKNSLSGWNSLGIPFTNLTNNANWLVNNIVSYKVFNTPITVLSGSPKVIFVVNNTGSIVGKKYLYSTNYFKLNDFDTVFYNGLYSCYVGNIDMSSDVNNYKISDNLINLYKVSNYSIPLSSMMDNFGAVSDYINIGGISNVYDRDKTLENYDIVPKIGNGTIADDIISLDWQNVYTNEKGLAQELENVITGVTPWVDALDKVGVVPLDTVTDKTIDNDVITDIPIENVTISSDIKNYSINLTNVFPFCLPFDLVRFIGVLVATPTPPKFTYTIKVPISNNMKSYNIDIDLSDYEYLANIFRKMELLAFIISLILITRQKIIRG